MPFGGDTPQEFKLRLRRIYVLYAAGFILMILFLALAEIMGMARDWIGYIFLLVTVSLYAGIGILCRTSDQLEYYVAGRRVPAFYNGMATAADCWTGGYVLVALLLAPYLRKFGQYTIPDFMGARYGGTIPRLAGVVCAVLCSFTYLVAQIYGVGIITTRMTGISFELGIFVALGGMLVCSFLGGMRAVTWTQVGQYIILVIAYLVPVVWLSIKHTDMPVAPLSAGSVLQEITQKEELLHKDPRELQVRKLWQKRADKMTIRLEALPQSWEREKERLRGRLAQMNKMNAPMVETRSLERELAYYPTSVEAALILWSQARDAFEERGLPPAPYAEPFPAQDPQEQRNMRTNFLALVLF
jgi:cation/acetate symporter